jgi:sialic acid synthase SpsE
MATFSEVKEAVEIFKRTGNDNLTILHCTSVYPSPPEIINLNNVNTLQEMFPEYEIGYSDHTIGIEVPLASIAMGCRVIEKHFTLDNSKIGMDNQMATEVDEFENLIKSIKLVHKSLGNKNRILSDSELRMKETMRRSLVAAVEINMGDTITSDMLTAKRPPIGIPPNQIDLIIGKKAQITIQKDRVINFEDIK